MAYLMLMSIQSTEQALLGRISVMLGFDDSRQVLPDSLCQPGVVVWSSRLAGYPGSRARTISRTSPGRSASVASPTVSSTRWVPGSGVLIAAGQVHTPGPAAS